MTAPFEPLALAAAAVVLAAERLTYVYIWRRPDDFREAWSRLAGRPASPVDAVRRLFYGFKLLQGLTFAAWCWIHGDGRIAITPYHEAIVVAAGLVAVGQLLNLSVFVALGTNGVFYGNRFGHPLPWIRSFPFSLVSHPQYVGTVLTIWGLFLLLRFPNPDWMILPALETVYYAVGSYFERDRA